jgi:DNA-binding NarL/FixJ family response regulator
MANNYGEVCMSKDNNPLTPALNKLLKTCMLLKTTDTKSLAYYLNRSPATIRNEFQHILKIMGVHCRYAALKTAEENGWLCPTENVSKDLK